MKKFSIIHQLFNGLLSIVVVLFLVVAPSTLSVNLKAKQNNINRYQLSSYSGILELWNIDTFEGGSVSRSSWLEKQAMAFERINKGVFIVVSNFTMKQAILNLEAGNFPNLISYGVGMGEIVLPEIKEYCGKVIGVDHIIESGKFNDRQMAVPYMMGGYFMFGDNLNKLTTGLIGYNNPVLSLISSNDIDCNLEDVSTQLDSYSAYSKFISNNDFALLGTQRDLVRINNRINNGKLESKNIKQLSGFTDLIQYISIGKCNNMEVTIATKFIEYLLSYEAQSSVVNIDMFSVLDNIFYSSSPYREYEKNLKQNSKTINIFLANDVINNIKMLSLEALTGNIKSLKEVNRYLI